MKNGYKLQLWKDATVGRGIVGYTAGRFIFTVTNSLAMEHMIIVVKWNEISSLKKFRLL